MIGTTIAIGWITMTWQNNLDPHLLAPCYRRIDVANLEPQ